MCYGVKERREARKRHLEKVIEESNWDGKVDAEVVQGPTDNVYDDVMSY